MTDISNRCDEVLGALPFIAGLVTTCLLSRMVVGRSLEELKVHMKVETPKGVPPDEWSRTIEVERGDAGSKTGKLEALFFYVLIWIMEPLAIGVWFAFKVASKWEVWQSIVKPPEYRHWLTETGGVTELRIRNQWGSRVLTAHLFGTLGNLLLAGSVVITFQVVAYVLFGFRYSALNEIAALLPGAG
jgi:hypothetical protein